MQAMMQQQQPQLQDMVQAMVQPQQMLMMARAAPLLYPDPRAPRRQGALDFMGLGGLGR